MTMRRPSSSRPSSSTDLASASGLEGADIPAEDMSAIARMAPGPPRLPVPRLLPDRHPPEAAIIAVPDLIETLLSREN